MMWTGSLREIGDNVIKRCSLPVSVDGDVVIIGRVTKLLSCYAL